MRYFLPLFLAVTSVGCGGAGPDINIFSIRQDVALGQQSREQILSDGEQFPILPVTGNEAAYEYLQGMVDEIVEAGNVPYADEFPYEVTIIDKDVRNAFATPGGYLYVYTGLITFLEEESQLAGVMAHEIAHSAERHSTDQLTQRYGLATLISLISGGEQPGLIEQVATSLVSLSFSRGDEKEADMRSVDYLCNTRFAADGAAGFFEQVQGAARPPEFLSTHPNPENRVAAINNRADGLECEPTAEGEAAFRRFQQLVN